MKSLSSILLESIQKNLNEDNEGLNFFETEGLKIAKDICKENNTNCKEVCETVQKAAALKNIECKVVEPLVIVDGETVSKNHFTLLYNDIIVDYTIKQFLGDYSTVQFYKLLKSGNDMYTTYSETLEPVVIPELEDADLSEIYSISGKYNLIIELL